MWIHFLGHPVLYLVFQSKDFDIQFEKKAFNIFKRKTGFQFGSDNLMILISLCETSLSGSGVLPGGHPFSKYQCCKKVATLWCIRTKLVNPDAYLQAVNFIRETGVRLPFKA